MPRNSSGTYSLPEAPVVADTVIDPDWANNTLNDLAAELTDSLSRSGDGGMTSYLRGIDGSAALPAYSFTNQNTLGAYRAGSGDFRVAFNGTDIFKFNTTENRSYNAFKVTAGGCTIDAGGLTVTAGGATVTAGGLTVTAGGLTVSAGGSSVTGSLAGSGSIPGPHLFVSSGTMATTSGNNYPLLSARATPDTGNVVNLAMRAKNTSAVTVWQNVDLGLSFDVDATVGAGGSIFFGSNGAKITSGTAATAADPANALTLENGNLKLAGTAPNSDEALSNTLTPANIVKAWVLFTATGTLGGVTIHDGFNVSGVTISNITQAATITFAQAFSSANYGVSGSVDEIASAAYAISPSTGRTSSACDITVRAMNGGGARVIYTNNTPNIYVEFIGRQA